MLCHDWLPNLQVEPLSCLESPGPEKDAVDATPQSAGKAKRVLPPIPISQFAADDAPGGVCSWLEQACMPLECLTTLDLLNILLLFTTDTASMTALQPACNTQH